MKHYYLPFLPMAKIDYLHLLALYDLAEYQTDTGAFDTIRYTSSAALAEQVKLSSSTISRILKSEKYADFLIVDREHKVITLNNNFRKSVNQPFVMLTAAEVKLIREIEDNLFAKYLIYLKYYCGFTKDKKNDFTAKQFLAACGYSTSSNDYVSKVSEYNGILLANGIIRIEKYTDELGQTRNRYTFV